jgi:hypothetical protein
MFMIKVVALVGCVDDRQTFECASRYHVVEELGFVGCEGVVDDAEGEVE